MNDIPPPTSDALSSWENHLQSQLKLGSRAYTFDMDDEPEQTELARFPLFTDALLTLNGDLKAAYREADGKAIKNQKTHHLVTQWAIATGAIALVLTIIQLAIGTRESEAVKFSFKEHAEQAEVVVAIAGAIAVLLGFYARFNSQWFIQRHRAERLRMLKFLALARPELWCGAKSEWESWLRTEMSAIANIKKLDEVKDWAENGAVEVVEPLPRRCVVDAAVLNAYLDYYRWKRVEFQASFFHRQARRFRGEFHWLVRLPLPVFALSVFAVVIHAVVDRYGPPDFSKTATSAVLLAIAALLPIGGLCVRAWLGAFEHVRSASLYEAKARALVTFSQQLKHDRSDLTATVHHVAHVEHFLEHEHREWLRLLLEAEWFL